MFKYVILSNEGNIIFQYPQEKQENYEQLLTPALYSELLTAIRTCCTGMFDTDIKEFVFGSTRTSLSRDKAHNVHALITNNKISFQKNKELHLAMKSLFLTTINKYGIDVNFENIPTGDLLQKAFENAFDLLRKTLASQLLGRQKT